MKKILLELTNKNIILYLLLFVSISLNAQSNSQTFTTTTTFTVPLSVTQVTVEAWGGGGHGSSISLTNAEGGGGSGGAYARKLITVLPGSTYTVNVGVGSSTNAPGGDSWFNLNTAILAKGGNSAADNSSTAGIGNNGINCIGDVIFSGGGGANGSAGNFGGGGGSSAGTALIGTTATNATGAIAPTGGGNGGNGSLVNGDGLNNPTLGGGGGGARRTNGSTKVGGNGANGRIIIKWDEPEINFQGNALSIVNGDTTPTTSDWTDFGSTDINTGTITRTFTIQNIGTATLTLGAITFSGANASEFFTTLSPNSTVIAGATTTFNVTFNPTNAGLRTATILIANNDSNENPYNFSIQGNGSEQEINVQGNSATIVNGDTTPTIVDWTNFGATDISSGTVTRTFTIQNLGTSVLTIGTISISGLNASEFSVSMLPNASVLAGGLTTFNVIFNPNAVGIRSATISFINNDGDENPYNFSILGTGTEQEINVLGNNVSIIDGDTTPILTDFTNFGAADINLGTVTRTFIIQNTGSFALTIGSITFSGANAGDFTLSSSPSASIAANGGISTFNVIFNPSALGIRSATISIVNNDSNENPYDFAIQGTGTTPEINVKGNFTTIVDGDTTPTGTDQTDFGSVSIQSGIVYVTYTIENIGTATLNIGAITILGTNAGDFNVTIPPSSSLTAGSTTTFQIGFNPIILGVKNASISIISNDFDENPYDFSLTGLGVRTYLDTDGDSVSDNFDIDDDNDGVLDTLEQTGCLISPFSNSVQYTFLNETFGYGTTKGLININIPNATCTYCFEDGIVGTNTPACPSQSTKILDDGEYCVNYKITGSTATDPENIHGDLAWYDGQDHTLGDVNGRMAIFNASFAVGTFYETTITGVIPNVPINYSFWVLNIMAANTYPNSILPNMTVEFADLSNNIISTFNTGDIGRCNGGITDNTCTSGVWKQFTTDINLGNITAFIIRFKNNAPGGGGNDLALDDIVIKQNYCDSDGDGIANLFDLDADNDGIPDIEESGYKQYSSGLAKMDLSSSTTWIDTNLNGLHDALDSVISGGTYNLPDTDGDTVKNILDLDSDNDSLFDVDEAGLINGDGDINGDGVGDGIDTDLDGILNIYDTSVGFGTNTRAFAFNTDSIGNQDYMQVDSNNDTFSDISATLYANLDTNNDGIIDGTLDFDKDGIIDTYDTNTATIGSPRNLDRKLFLDFDGRNDYGQSTPILGGLSAVSLMGWINLNNAFATDGVIIGQDKFQIRITSARELEVKVNATTTKFATPLNKSQWYHVAAVYDSSNLKLYLNGNLVVTQTVSGNIGVDASMLTLGRDPITATKFFRGKIDELRVFNVALTEAQLQKMVYQEIQNTSSQVRGTIIPKNIPTLPFSSLMRYYRMDAYKDDIIDDLTTPTIDTGTGMEIYNHKNIFVQQAPMPFITERIGNFATAVNSPLKEIRGMDIMDQDWSIVQVKHNITEISNNTDLGMLVDPAVTIVLDNDNKIQNDWFLKLDGKIDLVGKSQLIQTSDSDLDIASAGSIERDQQGQSNKFNYNYWCSPVGAINALSNNSPYTVASVMKDGTNPNSIQNLLWTTAANSIATNPVTLSSYWIFKFQNVSGIYANWTSVGQNGTLQAAQGFTLKGSDATSTTQNYTFAGKPNNGVITTVIAANNSNLSGNPYPSALDSNAFIIANTASGTNSITGTLYFWEHYSTNFTHVLAAYQGGYATRTIVGGTPPIAPAGISGLGSSSKTPQRFIPPGQGFFVEGSTVGGTITYNNNQRLFVKETNSDSNTLFKTIHIPATPPTPPNNSEDTFQEDIFKRVRLGFTSSNNYHRQVLIGFMDENATSGIDSGYDGIHIDNQPNDMYFMNGTTKLAIQGEGIFNINNSYPVTVKTSAAGNVKFILDDTENFPDNQNIYIHDNLTNLYHNINASMFEINLPAGMIENRFSLRFTMQNSLNVDENNLNDEIIIVHNNAGNMLMIKNDFTNNNIKSALLFNILGQKIITWEVGNQSQTNITFSTKNIIKGTYIVKVVSENGNISKKIIIQ